jgi:lipopolysaccharide export system permease protein
MQAFIRDNYVSVLLQEGVFNSPTKDLTVYIREIDDDGKLKGLLMHDRRVVNKPITMMAEEGKLIKTKQGPRFILVKGNRQEIDHTNNELSLLYFDRYALDLSTFTTKSSNRWREAEERYLDELFYPKNNTGAQHFQKLRAEGHNRITWPMYSILLTLLALVPFVGGEFNRRGQGRKILLVSIGAIAFIGVAISMKNIVAKNADYTLIMYGLVLGGIVILTSTLLRNHRYETNKKPQVSI